jgi:hypothetical protein
MQNESCYAPDRLNGAELSEQSTGNGQDMLIRRSDIGQSPAVCSVSARQTPLPGWMT